MKQYEKHDELERFRSLAFFYACDKLDAKERAWMDQQLAAHPDWQAIVAEEREFASATREAIETSYTERAPLVAFDDLPDAATIAARGQPKGDAATGKRQPLTLAERLRRWWRAPVGRGWAFASVAALALLAGLQTMRLAGLEKLAVPTESASTIRGGGASPAPGVPLLQVIFVETTTIAQIRKTLGDLELDVVRGPDEDGMLWLAVPAGDPKKALADLKATGLIVYGDVASDGK